MGGFLAGAGHMPELAVTSPARRASETLRIAMEAGGWRCDVRRSEALYSGGVRGLLDEVASAPRHLGSLLIVGHEPTCSEAIALLVGGCRLRFPTGAMACVELLDWPQAAAARGGSLVWLVTPRLITSPRWQRAAD